LIVSSVCPRLECWWCDVRSILLPKSQNLSRDGFADSYAICFVLTLCDLCQVLLKLLIEVWLKSRIERDQDIMSRLVCRSRF